MPPVANGAPSGPSAADAMTASAYQRAHRVPSTSLLAQPQRHALQHTQPSLAYTAVLPGYARRAPSLHARLWIPTSVVYAEPATEA